jgi:uncharacterized membrane protein
MLDLLHAGPAATAAFFASSVEAVEAATVILAAGVVRGWRSSLSGAAAGLAMLAAIVAAFGTAIASIPIAPLQVVVGTLLLLFGIRWLRKAMLRAAGVIELRDEEALYAREQEALGVAGAAHARWDTIAALTSFKAVMLEGLEVIVIVIGIGAAGNLLVPASIGAAAACIAVAIAAAALNRPLARVPENSLKFAVGIMVSAFGLFWFGEGIGIDWPFGDAAIPVLMAVTLAASVAGSRMARR